MSAEDLVINQHSQSRFLRMAQARRLAGHARLSGSAQLGGCALTPACEKVTSLPELAHAVVARVGLPVDGLTVAALLESEGWAETDAQTQFGLPGLLALGEAIWRIAWSMPSRSAAAGAQPAARDQTAVPRVSWRSPYLLVLLMLQVAILAVAGKGLGAVPGLTPAEAAAAGVGMLLALLWANSLGQLLARDPQRLLLEGNRVAAGAATARLLLLAMGGAIGAAAGSAGLLTAAGGLDGAIVRLGATVFLLGSLFWLAVNALFVLQLAWIVLAAATTSLLAIGYVQITLPLAVPSVWILAGSLLLANLFMVTALLSWWALQRRKAQPARLLPSITSTVFYDGIYALVGLAVMSLVLLDRLIAWQVGAKGSGLVFQPSYEIGLTWALVSFLLSMTCVEWLLHAFVLRFNAQVKIHNFNQLPLVGRHMLRIYGRSLVGVAAAAFASSLLVAGVVFTAPLGPGWLQPIVPDAVGRYVFVGGLVGYGLLALALFSSGPVIAASQPARLVRPLLLALAVDLVVAWYFAHSLGYPASVLGLVAGSAVLLLATSAEAIRLLREPVHTLYSA